jgi:hypothetical protein
MRIVVAQLVALAAAALWVGGASANGSPYSPGLAYGWDGVRAPGAAVRFVTLDTARSTVVAAIRVHGGRVVRSRALTGFYGVPLVAYDGTSGGLSGDGRSLVVASYGPLPGDAGKTRFAVLSTRTLRPRRVVELSGAWSYDAISPDGSLLYLVEHLSAGTSPRYRVRVFDLEAGRLLPKAIVDRVEREAVMRGQPVTRVTSLDGRWAYTLYARQTQELFVHALDTTRREAFCIDLPLPMGQPKQMALRLRLAVGGALHVLRGRAAIARIDTRSIAATRAGR